LKKDYEPFYIISDQEGGISVSMHEFDVERQPIYFYAMIDGESTIHEFNQHSTIDVPRNTKLYIWAQQIKNIVENGRAATVQSIFVVQSQSGSSSSQLCDFMIGGNLISLLIPRMINNSYVHYSTRPLTDVNASAFSALFAGTNVTNAENLILPGNTVPSCYKRMFAGCTKLVKAPTLCAETLTEFCYMDMFKGCTLLNHIVTHHNSWRITGFDDEREAPGTSRWMEGVSASGTFYKQPVLETRYGISYIPNGWTVYTVN
jgi:hypothetical protein